MTDTAASPTNNALYVRGVLHGVFGKALEIFVEISELSRARG